MAFSALTTKLENKTQKIDQPTNRFIDSGLILVFVLALAVDLIYHFAFSHQIFALAFDGKHYVASAQKLVQIWTAVLAGHANISLFTNQEFLNLILPDGPVVPALPALLFLLLGKLPTATDWRLLVVCFSCVQALSACLVYCIALKLTAKKAYAFLATLIFCFYPPAIISTGRVCSEIPAACLLLGFALTLSKSARNFAFAIAAGIMGGLICMNKPALIPAIALSIAYAGLNGKNKLRTISTLILSCALAILPWSVFTAFTTGRPCITAERWPSLNAAFGVDREADGYCTLPITPFADGQQTVDSPICVLAGQWKTDPSGCTKLALRRVTRLLATPWNDFRETVFGITAEAQQWQHTLLLIFGFFGASCLLVGVRKLQDKEALILGDVCVLLLGGHLVYIFFQSMGRYAFSATPFLAVLASFGIFTLSAWAQLSSKQRWQVAPAILIASLAVAFVFGADAATRLQDSHEVTYQLSPSAQINKSIDFSSTITPPKELIDSASVLLLVDGDKNIEGANIVVNGHKIADNLHSIYHFSGPAYQQFNTMREHSQYLGMSVDDFRQWRAVPVDPRWINWHGQNQICLTAPASGGTIYGDSDPSSEQMLSPLYFSSGEVLNSATSMEVRVPSAIKTGRIKQFSSIAYGNKTSGIIKEKWFPDSLRIKLAVGLSGTVPPVADLSAGNLGVGNLGAVDSATLPFPQSAFNPMLRSGDSLIINKWILKTAKSTQGSMYLPQLKPSSHIAINVTGKLRVLGGPGKVGLPVVLAGNNKEILILGKSPNYLVGTSQWRDFSIADIVPTTLLGGGANRVDVVLYPCPWQEAQYGTDCNASDAEIKDLKVSVSAVNLPELVGRKVIYY